VSKIIDLIITAAIHWDFLIPSLGDVPFGTDSCALAAGMSSNFHGNDSISGHLCAWWTEEKQRVEGELLWSLDSQNTILLDLP
jgi:hypothetical protein